MTVGLGAKPKVREFGNPKSHCQCGLTGTTAARLDKTAPQTSAETEPLVDVSTTGKGIRVVLEIPGAKRRRRT